MKRRATYRSAITALALTAIGIPFTAGAGAPSQFEDVSVRVSYSDLNIESAAGAKILYTRLKRATRKACDVRSLKVVGSIRRVAQSMECYNLALEAAVRSVDSDALDAVHAG